MNPVPRFEYWGDRHHPKWADLLRLSLGIYLVYKGVEFLNNMSAMMQLMDNQVPFGSFMLLMLGHYIVFAHLVGGFLLAVGLLTRFACLIQIPILLGALIFINTDMTHYFSEWVLSLVVLLLLVYFLIAGNGPWSLANNVYRDSKP